MTNRDLFRLACGVYELKSIDGIYLYTMTVYCGTHDGVKMFTVEQKGWSSRGRITFYESYVNSNGDNVLYKDSVRYKIIRSMSGIGGLSIHSNNVHSVLYKLQFIARGSFTKLIEFEKELNKGD